MSQNGSDNTKVPWQAWVVVTILVTAIPIVPQIIQSFRSSSNSSTATSLPPTISSPSASVTPPAPSIPSEAPSPQQTVEPTLPPRPRHTPRSESINLVGVWQADVFELGQQTRIIWQIRPDGGSRYQFSNSNGISKNYGVWRFSDGIIFESYPDGASAKGAIEWISSDHFELTVLDNGVPAYTGLKRNYYRLPL